MKKISKSDLTAKLKAGKAWNRLKKNLRPAERKFHKISDGSDNA